MIRISTSVLLPKQVISKLQAAIRHNQGISGTRPEPVGSKAKPGGVLSVPRFAFLAAARVCAPRISCTPGGGDPFCSFLAVGEGDARSPGLSLALRRTAAGRTSPGSFQPAGGGFPLRVGAITARLFQFRPYAQGRTAALATPRLHHAVRRRRTSVPFLVGPRSGGGHLHRAQAISLSVMSTLK